VDTRDPNAVRTAAHALKGAAGNLSAMGLFEAARTLERIGAESRVEDIDGAWRVLAGEAARVLDDLKQFEASRTANAHEATCAR